MKPLNVIYIFISLFFLSLSSVSRAQIEKDSTSLKDQISNLQKDLDSHKMNDENKKNFALKEMEFFHKASEFITLSIKNASFTSGLESITLFLIQNLNRDGALTTLGTLDETLDKKEFNAFKKLVLQQSEVLYQKKKITLKEKKDLELSFKTIELENHEGNG